MMIRVSYSLFDENNDRVQDYFNSDWLEDRDHPFHKIPSVGDIPIVRVIEMVRVVQGMLLNFPEMKTCQMSLTRPSILKPDEGYYMKLLVQAKL